MRELLKCCLLGGSFIFFFRHLIRSTLAKRKRRRGGRDQVVFAGSVDDGSRAASRADTEAGSADQESPQNSPAADASTPPAGDASDASLAPLAVPLLAEDEVPTLGQDGVPLEGAGLNENSLSPLSPWRQQAREGLERRSDPSVPECIHRL